MAYKFPLRWIIGLLLVSSMLIAAACSDDAESTATAEPTAGAQPTPATRAIPTLAPTATIQLTPTARPTATIQLTPTARPAATTQPTPTAQATAQHLPTTGPTPAAQPTVVAQLKRNAEEFEYSIGKPGGALTFATISEPLTLNLAIANDASSSGVLGYLFDGLTETSWLTDAVEPSLAESWERSEDGLTWTFNLLEPLQVEGNFTIYRRGPAFGTTFLGFNMNPGMDPDTGEPYLAPEKLEWFRNKQFRQAVAHVIDKDTIIDEVQHGQGYPQWSSISPAAGDFHNPNVRQYDYDIDKANEILDGLGWTDTNGDGIREDGKGNEIGFSLVTNSGNSVRAAVGALVHEGMEEIGIKADYRLIEFSDLVSQLIESYDWEAMIIGFTGGTDPYGGISFWHSSEGLHLWYPNQPSPATEWEAEIDELYIMGSQELDHDKRVGYYQRAQEVAAENVPVIYTTLSERLSAVRNAFGNLTPTLYALWDIRYLYRTDR